jgi:hypothetical protein
MTLPEREGTRTSGRLGRFEGGCAPIHGRASSRATKRVKHERRSRHQEREPDDRAEHEPDGVHAEAMKRAARRVFRMENHRGTHFRGVTDERRSTRMPERSWQEVERCLVRTVEVAVDHAELLSQSPRSFATPDVKHRTSSAWKNRTLPHVTWWKLALCVLVSGAAASMPKRAPDGVATGRSLRRCRAC